MILLKSNKITIALQNGGLTFIKILKQINYGKPSRGEGGTFSFLF